LLLLSIGGVFALLFMAALVVSFIPIPIDLTDYKGLVEGTASSSPTVSSPGLKNRLNKRMTEINKLLKGTKRQLNVKDW
jgi:hypothetical protein